MYQGRGVFVIFVAITYPSMRRREFLKLSAAAAAAAAVSPALLSCAGGSGVGKRAGKGGKLSLRYYPYVVELQHTFTISGFSRDTTTIILVEISYDGVTGYGESALPPYMVGQTLETATAFLDKVDLSQFSDPFKTDAIYKRKTSHGQYHTFLDMLVQAKD